MTATTTAAKHRPTAAEDALTIHAATKAARSWQDRLSTFWPEDDQDREEPVGGYPAYDEARIDAALAALETVPALLDLIARRVPDVDLATYADPWRTGAYELLFEHDDPDAYERKRMSITGDPVALALPGTDATRAVVRADGPALTVDADWRHVSPLASGPAVRFTHRPPHLLTPDAARAYAAAILAAADHADDAHAGAATEEG